MIKLKRIIHNGEKRIAVIFPFDNKLIDKIKKINGRQWNVSKRLWHVPDNADSINKLKELFPESFKTNENILQIEEKLKEKVYAFISKQHIILQLKKDEEDIKFLKSLSNTHWDRNTRRWIIFNNETNREKIEQFFGSRVVVTTDAPKTHRSGQIAKAKELHIFEHIPGRIKLIFKYDDQLIKIVKGLPYSRWDADNGWWTCVNTQEVVKTLKQFCINNNWEIKLFKEEKRARKKRIGPEDVPNYRECPQEYIDSMKIRRYSKHTIRTYSNMFKEFINYHYSKKPADITEKEIIAYIRYLVTERNISHSYQNQAINAIKYYYEKVLGESRKFYFVNRPKAEKVLPVVLSKEAIKKMIKLTNNLKHKCLIMVTYSGGLRLNEVQNLRIKDIDFDRKIINIKNGKGKKDRITLLSEKIILYLEKYFAVYQPKELVFEGIKGGVYSASSMEKVVKQAAARAGILQEVTLHTLRHSFATHLMEKGTDLRYIQNLLGHESIKTTEIYTHITKKGLDQIDNPLDDMDL